MWLGPARRGVEQGLIEHQLFQAIFISMGDCMMGEEKLFYKVEDLARIFGVNRCTVWRWVKDGRIPEPKRLSRKSVFWPRTLIDDMIYQTTEIENKKAVS